MARRQPGRGPAHAHPVRDVQRQLLPSQSDQPSHCASAEYEAQAQQEAWQPARDRVEAQVITNITFTHKATSLPVILAQVESCKLLSYAPSQVLMLSLSQAKWLSIQLGIHCPTALQMLPSKVLHGMTH